MSRRRKVIAICCFSLLVLYLASGIRHVMYAPERSEGYLWAVYHVHSDLSDGLMAPEEIARQAAESGVSLVLLTDHEGDDADFRKIIDGVHVVGGSETSTPEGHLTYWGADRVPLFKLPPFPPDAVQDIMEWGAFPVVAYPVDSKYQWQYWEEDFHPSGIEIMNMSSMYRGMNFFQKALVALHVPFSRYYVLKYFFCPSAALEKWEGLLKRRQTYGLFALNAHGGFSIGADSGLGIPSYSDLFSLMALGIHPHQEDPVTAVRKGDYFACIRGAGEPQRFKFQAARDDRTYPSGSHAPAGAALDAMVETRELETRLVLLKDGTIIETSRDRIHLDHAEAGVYRIEVFLEQHPLLAPDVPWIVSNPIIVGREDRRDPPAIDALPPQRSPVGLEEFHIEKDDQSSADIHIQNGIGSFEYQLALHVPGGENRWCALACREHRDLTAFEGFYLRAESDRYLRYFVEVRSGQRWYYASLKVYPNEMNYCIVPFAKFYRVNGGREAMPLAEIDSIFITTSNYTTRTNYTSTLKIHEMGFFAGVGPRQTLK
jgi:hypothetical protein